MIEKEILEALQQPAIAVAGTLSLAVKPFGIVIPIPNDGKWLELVPIPNNIEGQFWGDEKTYRGVFRLILHWPVDSEGPYPALTIMNTISGAFSKGSVFQNGAVSVTITEQPNLTGALEAQNEILYPVSVRYQVDWKG